jgi:hypothetical protein
LSQECPIISLLLPNYGIKRANLSISFPVKTYIDVKHAITKNQGQNLKLTKDIYTALADSTTNLHESP